MYTFMFSISMLVFLNQVAFFQPFAARRFTEEDKELQVWGNLGNISHNPKTVMSTRRLLYQLPKTS